VQGVEEGEAHGRADEEGRPGGLKNLGPGPRGIGHRKEPGVLKEQQRERNEIVKAMECNEAEPRGERRPRDEEDEQEQEPQKARIRNTNATERKGIG
jgi:hypothetical protein